MTLNHQGEFFPQFDIPWWFPAVCLRQGLFAVLSIGLNTPTNHVTVVIENHQDKIRYAESGVAPSPGRLWPGADSRLCNVFSYDFKKNSNTNGAAKQILSWKRWSVTVGNLYYNARNWYDSGCRE